MAKILDDIKDSVTLGKGKLLFQEKNRNGYDDMLEIDDFKYNTAVEKVEKFSSRSGNVVLIASIVKSTKVTGSFSCVAPRLEILRYFSLAKEVKDKTQNSGTLDYVSYTARLGRAIDLAYVKLSSIFVRKNAGTVFTADSTTDIITATAHGFSDGNPVFVGNSGGGLPGGLAADTIYYVRDSAANTLKLAATSGGAVIDLTSNGTGTNTIYRAYIRDTDYELDVDAGWLYTIPGGAITDGLVIAVKATYAQQAMYEVEAVTKVDMEGDLVFLGAPPQGVTQDFFAKAKLSPEGDLSMIGEDVQKFQINFEVIKSVAADGTEFYYRLRDRSGKSKVVAAVA